MNEIESHPDYQATYRRWLGTCLAAGRTRADAEQRARGHALHFISRQIERRRFYEGKRQVGPDAAPPADSIPPVSAQPSRFDFV